MGVIKLIKQSKTIKLISKCVEIGSSGSYVITNSEDTEIATINADYELSDTKIKASNYVAPVPPFVSEENFLNVPSAAPYIIADLTLYHSDGSTTFRTNPYPLGAFNIVSLPQISLVSLGSGSEIILLGTQEGTYDALNETLSFDLDDTDITVNGNTLTTILATADYDVKVVDAADGVTPVGTIVGGKVEVDLTCADATANIFLSNGETLLRALTIASGATGSTTIALATVNVKKSGGGRIQVVNVEAEASEDYLVADSAISINSVPFADVEATDSLAIEVVDDSDGTTQVGSLIGGKWQVTVGSTPSTDVRYADIHADTSLSTTANYDAGWLLANGYLDRTHPTTTLVQSLDYSLSSGIATTLLYNNIHGTKDRFTLDDGTTPTNNSYTPHDTIHQDHLYGIEFIYRDDSTYTWANALHDPTTDLGTGLDAGWFLLPINVFVDSGQLINNHPLYPIGVRPNQIYWSSSFVPNSTSNALVFENVKADGFEIRKTVKTALRRRLLMRFMTTHP